MFIKSKKVFERSVIILMVMILVCFVVRLLTINRIQIANSASFTNTSAEQELYVASLVNYVNKNSEKEDEIFIFSNDPGLYLPLDRKNSTRYDLPYISNTLEKRFEIVQDLSIKNPLLIMDNRKAWNVDEVSNEKRLPEVYTFILTNYQHIETLNGVNIYKRK